MSNANDWVLATEESGYSRHFAAEDLPVTIGGESDDNLHLSAVSGSLQIGLLGDVFFVQATKHTKNLRVAGELLQGSRPIHDGDVIALDSARLSCRLTGGRLSLSIEAQVTAGDTAPPDLEELARGNAEEINITPVSFRPAQAAARERSFRLSKTTIAIGTAFLILAVFGWFAFTAKSVQLVFEPTIDEMSLPETLFKVRLGDRFLLRSGTHRVSARLAGYYPLDTVVDVGQSPDQSIPLTLEKLPGLVTLRTEPEVAADVRVDGEILGRTPLVDVEIRPGAHQLALSAERYLSELRELEIQGGHVKQQLSIALTPNWATVSLNTNPSGAEVLVDGVAFGQTPIAMELSAGERKVEARLSGYNAWSERVLVVADMPQQLPDISLIAADGRVALVSEPSESAVSVNGEFRGRTPLTLRLSPGRAHSIVLSKPGHESATRELSVAADSGRELQITLNPQFGEVDVQTDPPKAEIWVDDELVGTTPSELQLMTVNHKIELRLDGYASQSSEITPRLGFPQTLSFQLEVLDDSSGSGYPRVIRSSLEQELRLIPAGQFIMGSSRRERERRSNEVFREVKIGRAFYLGVKEVSNSEFRALISDHDSGEYAGQSLNGDAQPVVGVTWDQVAQYLNQLSIKDGLQPVYTESASGWVPVRPLRNGYRLPTEAEWAWAAQAAGRDSILTYPWGSELPPPDRTGNYADLSANEIVAPTLLTYNDGVLVSATTGSFESNAVGIFDLGGNVAEWVQDFYEINITEPAQILTDPLGPESGRFHVIRGSSWQSATVTDLRLASRKNSADSREDLGFRIARNLE